MLQNFRPMTKAQQLVGELAARLPTGAKLEVSRRNDKQLDITLSYTANGCTGQCISLCDEDYNGHEPWLCAVIMLNGLKADVRNQFFKAMSLHGVKVELPEWARNNE